MTDFGNGLLVAIGIGMLIFVHELGHYLAARLIGARVDVFSLGFGPRILGFRRGPTDYRLSLIPLGGYVAVAGQDPEDMRHPEESLQSKTVGQRFLFFLGGVLMNVLFALVAFPIAFGSGVSFPAPVVGNVQLGSPAWEAGIEAKDRVLAVNGKAMYSFENLVVEVALAGPRRIALVLERNGEPKTVEVEPRYSAQDGLYSIGIEMALADAPAELVVAAGGAADKAGLRSGDALLAVDGSPARIDAPPDAATEQRVKNGEPVVVTVRRRDADGSAREITATLQPESRSADRALLGVEPMRRKVVGIRPGNLLVERLGIQRGDALLAVDGNAYRGAGFAGRDCSSNAQTGRSNCAPQPRKTTVRPSPPPSRSAPTWTTPSCCRPTTAPRARPACSRATASSPSTATASNGGKTSRNACAQPTARRCCCSSSAHPTTRARHLARCRSPSSRSARSCTTTATRGRSNACATKCAQRDSATRCDSAPSARSTS